ncbi:MAG: EAL domain-containing protein [Bacillota bacterium]
MKKLSSIKKRIILCAMTAIFFAALVDIIVAYCDIIPAGFNKAAVGSRASSGNYLLHYAAIAVFVMLIFICYIIIKGKITDSLKIGNSIFNINNLRGTFHNIGSGLIVTDKKGMVIFINPAAEKITGYHKSEANGRLVTEVLKLIRFGEAQIDLPAEDVLKDQLLSDTIILTKHSSISNISATVSSIYNNDNMHIGFIFVIHDISASKKEEAVLRKNEEKYRKLYHQAEHAMILIENGIVIDCSSKASELFRHSKKDIIGKSIYDLISGKNEDNNLFNNQLSIRMADTLKGIPQFFEWIFNCGEDLYIPVEISLKHVSLDNLDMVQATIYDLSDENRIIDSSQLRTDYDNLTKLPSRQHFYSHLNLTIEDTPFVGYKLAVLFIDLDLFKNINDTLGHDVGDALLQQAASRIVECCNASTDIVARMGGDEFAILLTSISCEEDATSIAKKVLSRLSTPFNIEEHELLISASIGIALYPGHGRDTHEVLKNAGSSMYKAKSQGRNSYQIYTPDINENTMEKFTMQKSLRRALERNELLLHYQPKVDGRTGKLVGIEALVRWEHPHRGLIYPAEFIPLAEETGYIKQIDEWVLRTACNQLKSWINKGHKSLRLAVNLSAWQFKEQHLAEIVASVLEETGIAPNDLELEITETAAMENLNFTVNTLGKLMSMGVNISIDDFGTGYSSLNYLKHFPINFLKIDKTFVADILEDKNTCAIVKAIIEVAHTLNLKVIAEGVETQEQLSLLQELGCDEIQGFYISKPLTVEEIENKFK